MTPIFTLLYTLVYFSSIIPLSYHNPSELLNILLGFDYAPSSITQRLGEYIIIFLGMVILEKLLYKLFGAALVIPIMCYAFLQIEFCPLFNVDLLCNRYTKNFTLLLFSFALIRKMSGLTSI